MSDDVLLGDGVVVVPYVEIDGARIILDSVIRRFWDQAVIDGAVRILFHNIDADGDRFLRTVKSTGNLPVFFFRRGGSEPIGVAWLNGLNEGFAFAHFFFLKSAWGKDALACGRACCRYWFSLGDEKPLFNVILGNIPSINKFAVNFVRKLGWTVVGEIPRMARGGSMTVTYLERS